MKLFTDAAVLECEQYAADHADVDLDFWDFEQLGYWTMLNVAHDRLQSAAVADHIIWVQAVDGRELSILPGPPRFERDYSIRYVLDGVLSYPTSPKLVPSLVSTFLTGPRDQAAVEWAAKRAADAQSYLIEAVRGASAAGVPVAVVARAAGVTRQTVYRWLE